MIEEKAKKQKRHHFPRIPWYGWVGAIIFLGLHLGLYKLGCFISEKIISEYWSVCPKIDPIDNGIPYTPYFFVEIYFLSYIFWFIVPLIVSTGKKENFINFMIYSTAAYIVGFIWLILMPAYMNRTTEEDLPNKIEQIKTPVTKWLAELILKMDGNSDIAWNLCPSYHCLSSALCAYALIKEKNHHIATRVCVYVMAFLIVCSTVLVKQHYFADVLGGLGVATIAFLSIKFAKVGERIMVNNPLFLKTKHLTKTDVVKAEDANETTKEERKEQIKNK